MREVGFEVDIFRGEIFWVDFIRGNVKCVTFFMIFNGIISRLTSVRGAFCEAAFSVCVVNFQFSNWLDGDVLLVQ